jgi:carboxyl-terminal processing protease
MKYTSMVSLLFCFTLTACGGGGNTPTSTRNTPDDSSQNSTWVAGQYDPSVNFASRCANPRSNYPDRVGSTTDENNWIRSWSHETYLWYDELPDIDPGNYGNPIAYFDQMKTPATTPSGRDKDQFHFTWDTEEYNKLAQSGISAGFGVSFTITSNPQRLFVTYSEPNSPAANANISRGAEILAIDNIYLDNIIGQEEVDTVNSALYPELGQTNTFIIRDLNATDVRSVTLTSVEVTEIPVYKTDIIEQGGQKIGYLVLNTFAVATAEQQLVDAINYLGDESIDELILDLRYNGGGYLAISAELGTMIAGDNALGAVYEELIFNDKLSMQNGATFFPSTAYGFSATEGITLPKLNLSKVYILSTYNTASASEALINGLRGIDVEVILIGGNTTGKPYGFYPTDNCGTTYFTIQFKGANAKGFGDYADGFIPSETDNGTDQVIGCSVADDLSKVLGDENENMLSTALHHIQNNSCPTSSMASTGKPVHPLSAVSGELIRPYPVGLIMQ